MKSSKLPSLQKLESWIDSYLNFEKTPKKNIFWLDTMRFFCQKFGEPEQCAPCFHVAGSKGKGSVSTFIASILDEAGYTTGIYTSPHILDFIERISSATGAFKAEVYNNAVEELMKGVQSITQSELPAERPITWFELVTLFSFLVFRQAKVDYSVFEVGLGGRLDSTNVVHPLCSIITPIELEHTEFLGDTVEKIAYEKGGIIKENTPVVIAQQTPSVRAVFEKIAEEKHAPVVFLEDTITNLEYKIKNIVINGDGADWTGNIVEGAKEIFQLDMAHIQKKIYMAVSDEEYLKQMQKIVYTENPRDIFSLIYNYKVELETDKKIDELNKVKELEEYLRNNEEGLQRYQYKLGYTEEQIQENIEQFPSLGSEESHMYCVCRDRMKKNRTSWSIKGAEALLKVIMNRMNNTIEEILNNNAKKKIQEELAERIPEPKKVKKVKQGKIIYAGKYQIIENFTEKSKRFILNMLKDKKTSELMLRF